MDIFYQIYSRVRIDTWSNLKQFITSLVIGVLVIALGYVVSIKPLQDKLSLQQKQIVIIRESVANKKSVGQERKVEQKKMALLSAQSSAGAFSLEMVNILNGLEKVISEAQVELYLFEPQPIRESSWLRAYPIKLELNGWYRNLLMFVNHMMRQHYFMVIEEMVLQKSNANDDAELNLKILLTVYKNKKVLPQGKLIQDGFISLPERDIFQPLKNQVGLFLWASHELHFLGLIKQAQKSFGVVSDPFGEIYRVVVGDKIGLNQSRITAINDNGIITTNAADNLSNRKK